ncbi:hypothetical protein SAMN05428959_11067 [Duganella sp. CF517]|uniref:hypothetical protein n=1 Tax=Duganella sp. CF517 TaxID=1881038 RepID=UPI0008D72A62|nr:hypothetical protein [Duganella sp. CF517]SEO57780.1 hypothetical protein SAMN05428959_11067 [Duganella sp. CF517]
MALEHAKPGEPIALTHAGEDSSTFSSIALTKTEQIELIRLVLPAGKEMPEHHVKGEITLLCVSGEIAVTTRGVPTALKPNQLLYLEGGAPTRSARWPTRWRCSPSSCATKPPYRRANRRVGPQPRGPMPKFVPGQKAGAQTRIRCESAPILPPRSLRTT